MPTIDKAIKRLTAYCKWRKPDPDDNFHESVQLGIEALKRIKGQRFHKELGMYSLLPGETEK